MARYTVNTRLMNFTSLLLIFKLGRFTENNVTQSVSFRKKRIESLSQTKIF